MLYDGPNRPIKMLLIEDNPGDVRLLEEAFRELEIELSMRVAKDGAEGLDLLFGAGNGLPDLILLDLNLPKVSGHDVLLRVKDHPRTRRIPVIVLTSSRADSDIRKAYELHANAYLRKPSSLEGLIHAVRQIQGFWLELAALPN